MFCDVFWWIVTDSLKDHSAFIIRVKQSILFLDRLNPSILEIGCQDTTTHNTKNDVLQMVKVGVNWFFVWQLALDAI